MSPDVFLLRVDPSAIVAWAALVGVLTLKMQSTSAVQLLDRKLHGRLRNPEDVAAFSKLGFRQVGVPDGGFGARADHVWRNDLENIPMFALTALALALLGAAGPAYFALLGLYGAFRLAHSACYLLAIQPWRTLSFFGALAVQYVGLGWLALRLFA